MSLKLYNTLSGKKEPFKPLNPGVVKMYCCGPTVYDYLHVGNFRGAVFYNLLRNWLERSGYEVTLVYNYTDVDDKIINRAKEDGVKPREIAERFIREFETDFKSLKLKAHSKNPRVTENIDAIIELIERLIASGKAYVEAGEVFYAVKSFKDYGKLSHQSVDALRTSGRIEENQRKRDALDFSLWKPSKPDEESWPSPWGEGRPGWHIECSAMTIALLGEEIDIHGGGIDLVFPHHENEIAQSEGATDKPFARSFVHHNLFTFAGEKMSKSLGNIRTMRSFLEQYHGEVFKYMVLSVHYRSLVDFSEATIDRAIACLARLYSALALAESHLQEVEDREATLKALDKKFADMFAVAKERIKKALDDDVNTPVAFAELFDLVRSFNSEVKRGVKSTPLVKARALAFKEFLVDHGSLMALLQEDATLFLRQMDDILLKQKNLERAAIDKLVTARTQARKNKDYQKADQLRDQLVEMGISLQDTPIQTYWEVEK